LNSGRLSNMYRSATGQVDLVLISFGGGSQAQSGMSAQFDPAQPTSLAKGSSSAKVDMRMTDAVIDGSTGGVGFGTPVRAVAGCYYVLKATYNAWDNVAESYPYYYSTTSWFSIGYYHGMTLGGATSSSGNYGTWSSGGGYSTNS